MSEPLFFPSQAHWRAWLEKHHADTREVTLGFHKKASGKGGITPDQALDEALCFGWIDGVRHRLNGEAFTNRYTPRVKRSHWSRVNIAKYRELEAAGRVHAAGRAVFEARDPSRDGERELGLSDEFEREIKRHEPAWEFWSKQPPWYRRIASFWVMSAKQEVTRKRRLATLIDDSAQGQRIGLVRPGSARNG